MCNSSISCQTIRRALELNIATFLTLSAGIYSESTININSIASLVIKGVPNATIFDCSRRQSSSTGAVFNVNNSTVVITDVIFQNCSNPTLNGGAVAARGSSVVVSQCTFTGCSAASGGAISVTGPGTGLFLRVENSTFKNNSANGELVGCPDDMTQPCSTWGGAIAAFEMFNVTISNCEMAENIARAHVPSSSAQNQSKSAVAGGGCLSVMFRGNASGAVVLVTGNMFVQCMVHVSESANVGNGVYVLRENRMLHFLLYF
jgi:hypothetical protein